jgi:cobalt/nickel transport system ATP-binding protein
MKKWNQWTKRKDILEERCKMENTILEVKDLDFEYEDGTKALDGISFKIEKGERVAILGSNGSGKSTLFLTLNGLNKPSKGTILMNNSPVEYSKKGLIALRNKVGIVFQEPDNQIFLLDIYEEIAFGACNQDLNKEEVTKRVNKVIEELNITPFLSKPTHFLSGGQKKQVTIADVLVMNPDIIILDEPTASLDHKHIKLVKKFVDNLSEMGITVIISTHDVDYAFEFADKIIVLKNGKVVKIDTPQGIFKDNELLIENNLEKPAVLKTYELLLMKKWILPLDNIPKNITELEKMI